MNEEMMFNVMAENYIANWMEILLEKHGLTDEKELTTMQIEEEIEEEIIVIDNEHYWNNGKNIAIHSAYIEYLKELLNERGEQYEL